MESQCEDRSESTREQELAEETRALLADFHAAARELSSLLLELVDKRVGPLERVRLMVQLAHLNSAGARATRGGLTVRDCYRASRYQKERMLGGFGPACDALVDRESAMMRLYARTRRGSC